MTARPAVVVLDYGSGNVHSACRALERAGAHVRLTADADVVRSAAGLVVPGVGAFAAVMSALNAANGGQLVAERLTAGRPVLGICVGLQVLFESSDEGAPVPGLGLLSGRVRRLPAAVVPHMGWNQVQPPETSRLLAGVGNERFYFVHSYAVVAQPVAWGEAASAGKVQVTWAEHGAPFVAALECGLLTATQFHPEKSGIAGIQLLRNWVHGLPHM